MSEFHQLSEDSCESEDEEDQLRIKGFDPSVLGGIQEVEPRRRGVSAEAEGDSTSNNTVESDHSQEHDNKDTGKSNNEN